MVFEVMNRTPQHTFQILTKRPGRVTQLDGRLTWTPNIWLGTSIESERWVHRLDQLKSTGAHTKFLSLEPLLGPLPAIDLSGRRLGYRRGRIRAGRQTDEPRMGKRNTGQLPADQGAFLLQAMGRRLQEADGADLGQSHLGRNALRLRCLGDSVGYEAFNA